jgi:hypothetical protein
MAKRPQSKRTMLSAAARSAAALGRRTADRDSSGRSNESTAWQAQASRAGAAVQFWNEFFNLQQGPRNDQPLSQNAIARILTLVRAISWVESQHGMGTETFPARDPMQCGNPADFWPEFVDCKVAQDRFVAGPDRPNYDACELPAAAAADTDFPGDAKVSKLAKPAQGHDDPAFNPVMSYSWAVPIFIHKMNTAAGAKTYQCGDLSDSRLIGGAVAYNGGGDPSYKKKIQDAIALIGGIPTFDITRFGHPAASADVDRAVADLLMTIRRVLVPPAGEERLFFPQGIDLIDVHVKVDAVEASVKIAGPSSTIALDEIERARAIAARLTLVLLPQMSGNGYYSYSGDTRQWGTATAISSIVDACRGFSAAQGVEAGVGDISLQAGGQMPPHQSHQLGREADFRPVRSDSKALPVTIQDAKYSRDRTAALVKALQDTGHVRKILFNDTTIPGVTPFEGHDNHLHVAFDA